MKKRKYTKVFWECILPFILLGSDWAIDSFLFKYLYQFLLFSFFRTQKKVEYKKFEDEKKGK
ncbi:MAG: hypothetical protein DRN05_04075 [Thermoplasmata archaeon]|nr:MAG: hypothetical protein DRN05_04075 [Thermoplasmata archaeon]